MSYVSVPFSQWRAKVLPWVPNCAEIICDEAVRAATIEFCELSHWLQYTCPAVPGVGQQAAYPVLIPSGTDLVRLQSLYYDNFPLKPQSEDTLRMTYSVDWRTFSGSPRYWTRDPDDDSQVVIVPFPETTDGSMVSMVAVIRPSAVATSTSLDLFNKWWEPIAAGAISRLCSLPGSSFTNSKLAAAKRQEFFWGVDQAKIDRNRTFERALVRMRPNPLY